MRAHRDLIIAWANGADIQYYDNDMWIDCQFSPIWDEEKQYRIKPETQKYRVALFDGFTAVEDSHIRQHLENRIGFVKWLTDWVEYEVP